MIQQTRDQSNEADYEIELIATGLAAQAPGALTRWQEAFVAARDRWQLDRATVLLRLLKGRVLDARGQGLARYLEGTLLVKQAAWPAAAAAYQRSLALHRAAGSVSGQVTALNGLANVLRRLDRPLDEVAALYQQALALAETLPDAMTRAGILNGLGLTLYGQGQLAAADARFCEALDITRSLGDQETEAAVLHNLGSLAWTRGQLAQAAEHFAAAAAIQETLGDPHGLAETVNSLGLVAEARGEWAAAAEHYERSLAAFQASGDLYGQVQALTNLGNVAWLLGRRQEGRAYHEEALALARDLGDAHLEGQVLTSLGDAYSALGLYREAEAAFLDALARKEAAGDRRSLKHTWFNLAGLYLARRRHAEAEKAYREALALAQAQQDTRIEAFTWLGLAKLAALREEWAQAGAHLDVAWAIAERADYPDCQAGICQLRGDLARLAAQPDSELILRHYVEACACAATFNERTLAQVLDYLVAVWSAHAEDGHVAETIWFCDSMIALWQELGWLCGPDPGTAHSLRATSGALGGGVSGGRRWMSGKSAEIGILGARASTRLVTAKHHRRNRTDDRSSEVSGEHLRRCSQSRGRR
jgi:tetratricopeptide (TPR) repeat protein